MERSSRGIWGKSEFLRVLVRECRKQRRCASDLARSRDEEVRTGPRVVASVGDWLTGNTAFLVKQSIWRNTEGGAADVTLQAGAAPS